MHPSRASGSLKSLSRGSGTFPSLGPEVELGPGPVPRLGGALCGAPRRGDADRDSREARVAEMDSGAPCAVVLESSTHRDTLRCVRSASVYGRAKFATECFHTL
jgi:hypothetical protein